MLQRTLRAGFIAPWLPTKADTLPSGGLWIHEIKHDGFRVIARKDGDREGEDVRLYSRPGNNWGFFVSNDLAICPCRRYLNGRHSGHGALTAKEVFYDTPHPCSAGAGDIHSSVVRPGRTDTGGWLRTAREFLHQYLRARELAITLCTRSFLTSIGCGLGRKRRIVVADDHRYPTADQIGDQSGQPIEVIFC